MIKIVIADDEKMIREGLQRTIPWNKFGAEIVGLAKDGDEALQLCRLWHPNILITDIRMPKMTGIELIKVLHGEMPFIRVVILSGYDDFEYAKAAIRYEASDYLVKPINASEVEYVIKKIVEDMKTELENDSIIFERYREMTDALSKYYNALCSGEYEDSKQYLLTVVNELVMKKMSVAHFQSLCVQLATSVISQLKQKNYTISEEMEKKFRQIHIPIADMTEHRVLIEFINNFNNELVDWLKQNSSTGSHYVMADVYEYIEEHYTENIGLEDVAAHVDLNKDYFSHIFKRSVGEGFSDYINKKRVEKAKELLASGNYKVYEISDMVGYQDYKYFGMVFKKFEGVSPTKYRKIDNNI